MYVDGKLYVLKISNSFHLMLAKWWLLDTDRKESFDGWFSFQQNFKFAYISWHV